jgi:hypothetical protein
VQGAVSVLEKEVATAQDEDEMMSSKYRFSVLALSALMLAACGGGGGGSTPPVANTPPPTNTTPDPIPEPTPDPTPDPDPVPDPDPDPVPKIGFDRYKEGIEEQIAAVIMLDKLGKSDVKRIPELVADQATAHGPTPMCGDDPCDAEPYVVLAPTGEEITVHQWLDFTKNGQYDFTEETMVYSYTNFQGMTGGSMGWYDTEEEMWAFAYVPRYDFVGPQYGMNISGTTSFEYNALFYVRELEGGRIEMGDIEFEGNADGFATQTFYRFKDGELDAVLDTYATVTSNIADMDQIDATIEWFPAVGEGLVQKLESTSSLDFGVVDGELVLEAGSFQYMFIPLDGEPVTVRMTVDADPAYLAWKLDEDGDGTFELTGRIAQSDFRYVLP